MLIEKAFAKLHAGYQNIEGGWVDDALVDLAGGVADRIRWSDEKTKTALHDGSLWTMLLKYRQQGFLLGCGSPVGKSDSEADASPWGIVQSHAYSVLDIVAVDGIQLIRVRNPWGRVEWTGDWGDKSPLWTRRMKTKVNFVDREDGAFWMSWQDFCINFDEVYVARFYSPSVWISRGKVYGEWRGPTAGGCMNEETVQNNVQYGLTVLEAGPAEISVSLLQEDVRGKEGKSAGDFPCIILELYEHQGKIVTRYVCQRHGAETSAKATPRQIALDDIPRSLDTIAAVSVSLSGPLSASPPFSPSSHHRGRQLATACDNLQEIFIEVGSTSDIRSHHSECRMQAAVRGRPREPITRIMNDSRS